MARATAADAFVHCAAEVRLGDKDRYLAALFAPEEARRHLMALYAFNLELARVPETVSEPALGEIKLQWWRETLEKVYGRWKVDHPVARAMTETVRECGLPSEALEAMIEARRFDLYCDPVPDLAFLEGYGGETASALIQLAAIVLAGPGATNTADAAGHAGVAHTLTGIMRAFAMHRARGQVFIPEALLAQYDLTPADVLEARNRDALSVCLADLRNSTRKHLADARKWGRAVPPEALPAFLPISLVELYLDRMDRPGYDPYKSSANVSQLARQWRLWRCARKGTF